MYTPIESDEKLPKPQSSTRVEPPKLLHIITTCTVWISSCLFAIFTAGHYIRQALARNIEAWESTDPGLYRPGRPVANYALMLLHFIAGTILMVAGPIQLIPSLRRRFISVHRVVGRVYIAAALIASICATTFAILYGTSRGDHYEDAGNILFGTLVLVCAYQSYKHAAITKKIESHKLWSWRLYSLVLGALLYRLYVVVYFAFLLFTPWSGCDALYESLYFLFYLPNLAVVEILWRKQQDESASPHALAFCIIFLASISLAAFISSWMPAILGKDSIQGQALDTQNNG